MVSVASEVGHSGEAGKGAMAAYVTDEAKLKALSASEATALSDALSALGDKNAKGVVTHWLATQTRNSR